MNVKITAIENAGLGCIKGDVKTYIGVEMIEDNGAYYNLVIPARNMAVRVSKQNWKVEII